MSKRSVTVRLDDGVYEWLRLMAEQERRTISGMVDILIARAWSTHWSNQAVESTAAKIGGSR